MSDPTPTTCPRCSGTGASKPGSRLDCDYCSGTGRKPTVATLGMESVCPICRGTGQTHYQTASGPCPECRGSGLATFGRVPPAPMPEPTPEQRAGHLWEWERLLAIIEDPDLVTTQATTDAALAAIRDAEAAAFARGRAEGLREAEQELKRIAAVYDESGFPDTASGYVSAAGFVAALAVPPDDRGGK